MNSQHRSRYRSFAKIVILTALVLPLTLPNPKELIEANHPVQHPNGSIYPPSDDLHHRRNGSAWGLHAALSTHASARGGPRETLPQGRCRRDRRGRRSLHSAGRCMPCGRRLSGSASGRTSPRNCSRVPSPRSEPIEGAGPRHYALTPVAICCRQHVGGFGRHGCSPKRGNRRRAVRCRRAVRYSWGFPFRRMLRKVPQTCQLLIPQGKLC